MKGSCLCKKIQYQIHDKPKACGNCYCKSCQIVSGSDHVVYLACTSKSVEIKGKVKWYSCTGDSCLSKEKGFCPDCATNLFGKPSYWPHLMIVYAGSLHDSSMCQPEVNLWLDEAPKWAKVDPSLKLFDKNPA